MKKFGILIFAVALILGVIIANLFSFGRFSQKIFNISINSGVTGSGVTAAEKRDVSDFNGVDSSGIFQVEIVAQQQYAVEVEADDNLLPLIRTEVRGGTLHLETDRRINSSSPIRVTISVPNIERLAVSGVSKVTLSNLKNDALDIETSGASKVFVSGETSKLSVEVSGASNIDASGLQAEVASVDASGASHVSVAVSRELKTDASGASKILYTGNPANIIKRTSGAGKVAQK